MAKKGCVILVGAGPGDPGLLTLAGKAALERADVVLYDRLVGDGILAMMPAAAVKIDVGKNKGSHPVPQDEINRLIVQHALDGKTVVRLKGGDPYLFGRGAEELEQVVGNAIRFRVVPGVTSAIAAPAYAGIPVTHRDYSSSLHILTGHGKNGTPPDIPYPELARLNGTLVFLMGLSAIEEICRGLVSAGMAPETPAALVENGSRDSQRQIAATVATLPGLARERAFASPALLVVGRVCALADSFNWRAPLPLHGKKILVVSSRTTGSRLAARLRDLGCMVDEFTGIATEKIALPKEFWMSVGKYKWIVLTSRTGAELFFDGLVEHGLDIRALAGSRFAVVGSRTGAVLAERCIRPDFMPEEYNGRRLGEGLVGLAAPGDRFLLFRAESGGEDLPGILRENSVEFDDVAAYRTIHNTQHPEIAERLRAGQYDAVTFTSASSVEAFANAAPGRVPAPPAFCIGEMTAAAARKHGMRTLVAAQATIEALADTIVEEMGQG